MLREEGHGLWYEYGGLLALKKQFFLGTREVKSGIVANNLRQRQKVTIVFNYAVSIVKNPPLRSITPVAVEELSLYVEWSIPVIYPPIL